MKEWNHFLILPLPLLSSLMLVCHGHPMNISVCKATWMNRSTGKRSMKSAPGMFSISTTSTCLKRTMVHQPSRPIMVTTTAMRRTTERMRTQREEAIAWDVGAGHAATCRNLPSVSPRSPPTSAARMASVSLSSRTTTSLSSWPGITMGSLSPRDGMPSPVCVTPWKTEAQSSSADASTSESDSSCWLSPAKHQGSSSSSESRSPASPLFTMDGWSQWKQGQASRYPRMRGEGRVLSEETKAWDLRSLFNAPKSNMGA